VVQEYIMKTKQEQVGLADLALHHALHPVLPTDGNRSGCRRAVVLH
jgi:hypothetical protein